MTTATTDSRTVRVSTYAVVAGIGAVAAYVSYRHAYELAYAHGETGPTARLLPLTIDGLVYVSSMVMLDAARRGEPAPRLAKASLALGIGAIVAANVLHGIAHGLVGAVISAWPAVALILTVELAMAMIRRARVASVGLVEFDPLVSLALTHFAHELAAGEVPSVRKIMAELKIGHPKAARVRRAMEAGEAA